MAVPILGTTSRSIGGGRTALDAVGELVSVRLEGQDALVEALLRAATRAGVEATKPLNEACRAAMKPIMESYKNSIADVTGNLRKSVIIRGVKGQRARGVGVAIGGPSHASAGKEWDVGVKGAGNHAWLIEYGTGRRRPGTQGRRTYLNVHEKINQSFRKVGDSKTWFNNEQFEKMGRGFYFIMGSKNEPTRQARKGSGYPHDFGPYAIAPGQTYGAVEPQHAMDAAIRRTQGAALNTLMQAVRDQINRIQAA